MGLRQSIRENPKLLPAVLGVALMLGGGLYATAYLLGAESSVASDEMRAFFTVDEGRTTFADSAVKYAPFRHEGREAVRAYLFRCGSGKPFVNHLERYKPEAKATLESLQDPARKGPPNIGAVQAATRSGREVKRPGDRSWTDTANLQEAGRVTTPKCPDGAEPAAVVP